MRGRPLAQRTRLLMTAVAAISVAVVFVVFYSAWTTYTVRVRTGELSRQALAVAKGVESRQDEDESEWTEQLRESLFRVQAGLIGATLAVTDEAGAILSSSVPPDERTRDEYPIDGLGDADSDGVRTAVGNVSGVGSVVMVAAPIEGDPPRYLVAIQPVREVNRAQGYVLALLLGSAAAAVLVAWAVGAWFSRRLTGPLVRLTRASEAVAAGDWGHQVPVEGDDEVASLATSFNQMSGRVADAYRAQKEFVGNVSHELRTPITSISGFAGAMLDGTVTDASAKERYLTAIRDEADRIGELGRVLLALADLDAGAISLARLPVDPGTLVEALRTRHGPAAEAKGLEMEIAGPFDPIVGDEERLLQAVSPLVENAIAYTPEGGHVRLRTEVEGARWRFVVEDSGPGVPEEDRDSVFDRFARVDRSRSSGSGGSGLGLAISRTLADLMGGRVWVDDSVLGGARFVLEVRAAGGTSTRTQQADNTRSTRAGETRGTREDRLPPRTA